MTHAPLPERLDALARKSGLHRMALLDRSAPRTMRWLPLFSIAALAAGTALLAGTYTIHAVAAGIALFLGGNLGVLYARHFGPRLFATHGERLDEREAVVKAQAIGISGTIFAVLAMLICFYMGLAGLLRLWQPNPSAWMIIGLALQGCWQGLPPLVASWLQPRELSELE